MSETETADASFTSVFVQQFAVSDVMYSSTLASFHPARISERRRVHTLQFKPFTFHIRFW
jgi:hypothetical protein